MRRGNDPSRIAFLVLSVCLLASACVSATALDARLTADGRAAVGTRGQTPAKHVDDMMDCRERLMDGLFYVGAYAVYFPYPTARPDDRLREWRTTFAGCMRERGYELPPVPGTQRRTATEASSSR